MDAGSKHATGQIIIDSGAMTVTLPLFSMLDKIINLQKLNFTQNSISKIFVPLMEMINILNLKGHYYDTKPWVGVLY